MGAKLLIFCCSMLFFVQINAQKIKGVCLVGPFEEDPQEAPLSDIKGLGADWLSLSPEVSLDRQTLELNLAISPDAWTPDVEATRELITRSKSIGLKVFLKPHIVLSKHRSSGDKIKSQSTWRGDIEPINQKDWLLLEKNYRSFILSMASLAEELGVDLFCIGTELKSFIAERHYFWIDLIQDIKEVYSGPITYSANWDNFQAVTFWDDMDFIGLNAYFPVSSSKFPSERKVIRTWQGIISPIKRISNKKGKQVIVTEFGYRNVYFSGQEPWTHVGDGDEASAYENQSELLNAFFKSIWKEEFVLGGFLWNWNYKRLLDGNTDFTIQNKPAQEIVKGQFKLSN